jgi:putative endonuclease
MDTFQNIKNEFQGEDNKRKKGEMAEQMAAVYLAEKGFEIVKRNFRFGKVGEIDIIARDGSYLAFVEVKARTNETYGHPLESITPSKQRTIRKVAEFYLYVNNITNEPCRFDVVVVDLRSSKPKIEHLENAF